MSHSCYPLCQPTTALPSASLALATVLGDGGSLCGLLIRAALAGASHRPVCQQPLPLSARQGGVHVTDAELGAARHTAGREEPQRAAVAARHADVGRAAVVGACGEEEEASEAVRAAVRGAVRGATLGRLACLACLVRAVRRQRRRPVGDLQRVEQQPLQQPDDVRLRAQLVCEMLRVGGGQVGAQLGTQAGVRVRSQRQYELVRRRAAER
eukprot:scaffold77842_cov63-Phaeocystis_antarctica.AAC.3